MGKKKERALRQEIIDCCLQMNALGINQGTSGNISARWQEGLLITPSGVPYEQLEPDDIVYMDGQGQHDKAQTPSSEWRFHVAILQNRNDLNAVVHTHSLYATAIAIMGWDIPALHYMIAAAGGPTIRCAPYATFGSEALSEHALQALQGRTACLLANHGVIATGPGLAKALWLAKEVEVLAQQFYLSAQMGGPNLLSDHEIERVVEKFKSYGARPKPKPKKS
ncbi:MAG: L-fuculose-phosphate aldolase [Candidatus Competibacteraceae bacterium]|nr:L-fuculose-phosphate aldolase [Candidatus Competibacteraceae bacterium]